MVVGVEFEANICTTIVLYKIYTIHNYNLGNYISIKLYV